MVQTLEVRISAGSDDAEERLDTGSIKLSSSDLELITEGTTREQLVGMRFNGITIPPGAIITNAYIQFQADEADSAATSLFIQGEASLNAQTFTSANGNISSRLNNSGTQASVGWQPAAWNTVGEAGVSQQTPDISAVIQEIIDQNGWITGNSLALLMGGTGQRVAESFNGVAGAAPLLHIEFDTGTPPPNAPPTVALTNTVATLSEDTDTSIAIKVADIVISDDGQGTNTLSLTGAHAGLFQIVGGTELFLIQNAVLTGSLVLDVTVAVDDTTVGTTPDDTAQLAINVVPPGSNPQVLEVRVSAGNDDAEERLDTGSVKLSSSDLELITEGSTREQVVGIRFNGIDIPAGAVITNAYIQFQADEADSASTSLFIHGEATLNALAFTTANSNISSRLNTSATQASVAWQPAAWNIVGEAGLNQQTPNIAAIIQEIINQGGWVAGSSLALLVSGTGQRVAESFNGVQSAAPLLHIEFDTGIPPVNNPPTVVLTNTVASLPENTDTSVAIKVADIVISDDGQGTNTLSLTGADAALFQIVGGSELFLRAGTVLTGNPVLDVTVRVDDVTVGTTPDDTAPLAITITPPAGNTPPTILNLAGDAQAYQAAQGATVIEQGGDALAQDPDSPNFAGGQLTVSISSGGGAAEDILSIQNQGTGAGLIGVNGANVTFGGTLIGTSMGGSGGTPLVVTLNGAANAAAATALVRAVTFEDTNTTSPTLGPRNIDFTLSDGDGGTSAAFGTIVNVSAVGNQTLEVRVSASSDDAEERVSSGSVKLSSSDLELITESGPQVVGMRFNGIDIPAGAVITNAYLQFQADETNSAAASLVIQGEATVSAQTFTSANSSISSRPTTMASVPWLPAAWNIVGEAGPNQQTPNLAAVIQEIIDLGGWTEGGSLALLISGSGKRTAESFNGVQSAAPLLHIEYSFVDDGVPKVDLDGNNSSGVAGNGYATVYFVGSTSLPIADVDVMISDSDDLQLASARVTLTNPQSGDALSFSGLPSSIAGSLNPAMTEVTLTGNASLADYTTAIEAISFDTSNPVPVTGNRTVEVVVNDGVNDSAVATSSINVADPAVVSFWVVADSPYNSSQAANLTQFLNNIPPEVQFVSHLGDIQSQNGSFSLSVYENAANILQNSSVPVFIIPGDNEWNDTNNPDQAWINWESTFSFYDQNWQHNFPVAYQAARPENFSYVSGDVLFIGINLVGGAIHDLQEWLARGADDLAWIEANFAAFGAQTTSAVIFGHANPSKNGYGGFEAGFVAAAQQFGDPILYLQGDTHQWDLSHPYASAPNITKVVVDQTGGGSGTNGDPLLVSVNSDPISPFSFDHDFGLIA